jgi:HPr kinase/phosphorylase
VLLEVLSVGVLLTGASGVGKSELALELITRGHRLVTDDAPELERGADNIVTGHCPAPLAGFLEVRGMGILDIRAMFGDASVRPYKRIGLIIKLVDPAGGGLPTADRVSGSRGTRSLLGADIPEITLPVAVGHNLAVQVEAGCRDHLLRKRGYAADQVFARRQQAFVDGEPG